MRRRHRTTVRLTGIALRTQGTHDSLCAYYSAAMLLTSLRPELDERFDAAHVALDPLYGNLPRRGRSLERAVADWLASGVRLSALCDALNRACDGGGVRTRFRFRSVHSGNGTVEFLRARVDEGLPCILGWESREMGMHTSLVVGYERFARSPSRWFRLLDPIRSADTLEWSQLAKLATAPLEIVWCESHDGVRPDKLTVERDGHGKLLSGGTRVERWEPADARWRPLLPR